MAESTTSSTEMTAKPGMTPYDTECCTTGFIHTGTAVGHYEVLGGYENYVSLPAGEYDKTKALVFLTDLIGMHSINAHLLADDFARNGIPVYMPDILNGHEITMQFLLGPDFVHDDWSAKHGPEVTRPPIDACMKELRARGVKEFAATGYCLGGRYVVDLAIEELLKVGIISHPSLLEIPKDLIAIDKAKRIPILWNTAEQDIWYGPAIQAQADKIFKDHGEYYKRHFFPGVRHGFAVRGDLSVPHIKAGKEGAMTAAIQWYKKFM